MDLHRIPEVRPRFAPPDADIHNVSGIRPHHQDGPDRIVSGYGGSTSATAAVHGGYLNAGKFFFHRRTVVSRPTGVTQGQVRR
jgi:hypothetical protein